MKRPLVSLALATAVVLLSAVSALGGPGPRLFTGRLPADPKRPPTWAWEPGLSMDARGVIWVVGNHCALIDQHGACQANPTPDTQADFTPLWRSTDGGRHYRFVSDPMKQEFGSGTSQDRPGGNDTDVAVAPLGRRGHPPLLYVVSLYGVESTLAISGDNGRTWRIAQVTGQPAQDRPWLATAGPCTLYLAYHPLSGSENVASVARVERYNGCALFDSAANGQVDATPQSSTLVEPPSGEATAGDQVIAKIAVAGRSVYVAYIQCDTAPQGSACNGSTDRESVHVAISRDRAQTFTDVTLPKRKLNGTLQDGTWPISEAADRHGHVVVAVTDTKHLFLWTSSNRGRTWHRRRSPVDARLGWKLAVVPSVAVRRHRVAVAWSGSAPSKHTQAWKLVVAVSTNGGKQFRISVLPQVLARSARATSLADGLYDDFGTGITAAGHVVVAYTASCIGHRPSDRSCPGPGPNTQGTTDVIRYAWLR